MTPPAHLSLAALLTAAALGGCLSDTVTPLRMTDGEPPPVDHGPLLDERVPDPPMDARPSDGTADIVGDMAADIRAEDGTLDTDGDTAPDADAAPVDARPSGDADPPAG